MTTPDRGVVDRPDTTRASTILVTVLIAVAMSIVEVMLHEYAHAVVQLALGADSSTVSAMSAEANGELSLQDQGWTAAAGPLFSLVLGVAAWLVARSLTGAAFQMSFWMYVAALQNIAGYLIINPFGVGDTAVVVDRWGWPVWSQFVMLALGVVMMFGIAALVAKDVQARTDTVRGVRTLIMWPVLWATTALVLLSFVLALVGGYEVSVVIVMVASMVSVYVAALMSSMFWGRFRFLGIDGRPGTLGFASVLAVVAVTLWIFHGVFGVTIG